MHCRWHYSGENDRSTSLYIVIGEATASQSVDMQHERERGCYDNTCSESFFHSLKVEAIHGEKFEMRAPMRETVFESIEVDYNRQRLHSYLDYRSPEEFE